MPKEQVVQPISHVYDAEGKEIDQGLPSYVKPVPEGGSIINNSGLAVHWSNAGGHLQVSATVHIDQLRAILKSIDDGEIGTSDGFYGVYVDVSRYEANNIIKTIRRARNSAFGEDA